MGLRFARKLDLESASSRSDPRISIGFHGDFAPVQLDNPVGHRKTKPGPPSHDFGGEEGLEELLHVLPWNSRARVLDFEDDPVDRKSTRLNSSHLGISYA